MTITEIDILSNIKIYRYFIERWSLEEEYSFLVESLIVRMQGYWMLSQYPNTYV
jgi:hypothetical protein